MARLYVVRLEDETGASYNYMARAVNPELIGEEIASEMGKKLIEVLPAEEFVTSNDLFELCTC